MDEGRPKKGVVNLPQVTGKSRDQAGKAVGVSGKYVDMASELKDKEPEVYEEVKTGKTNSYKRRYQHKHKGTNNPGTNGG